MPRTEKKVELPKTVEGLKKMTSGERLQYIRQLASVSVREMARRLGSSRENVYAIERPDGRKKQPKVLRAYERALGLEPHDLDDVN